MVNTGYTPAEKRQQAIWWWNNELGKLRYVIMKKYYPNKPPESARTSEIEKMYESEKRLPSF